MAKSVRNKRRRNPIPFAIFAKKGMGPRMSFNGQKFTNNSKPKFYTTKAAAYTAGRVIVSRHARILHGYRVTVEPARRAVRPS